MQDPGPDKHGSNVWDYVCMKLEHANMCVRDIDAMVRFLQTAFPEFRVRHDAEGTNGRWMHIGTDDTYIALSPAKSEPPNGSTKFKPYSGMPGVNHLAYVVEDADALRDRMLAAGYKESTPPNNHKFRKRIYFYDPEGNDWEFVQYYTDDPAERNDYDLPDK